MLTSLSAVAATLLATCLLSAPSATALKINGLIQPTGFSIDASSGIVWISEKEGVIKAAASLSATTAGAVTGGDLSARVLTVGDHGLTSVYAYGTYLFVTYQARNTTANCTTDDDYSGNTFGKVVPQPNGCQSHGVLTRFTVGGTVNAPTLTNEVKILDSPYLACAQFSYGAIAHIEFDATGNLYVSVGAGGNSYTTTDAAGSARTGVPDYGQYGNDPCGVGNAWGGHMRAQDVNSFDGKILKVTNPTAATAPFTITPVARGFHNPWRMTWRNTTNPSTGAQVYDLFVLDTGLFQIEEINGPIVLTDTVAANNYGFPCTHGAINISQYNAPSLPNPVCTGALQWKQPQWVLVHDSTSAVISSIGWNPTNNRFYVGDYVNQQIFSIAGTATMTDPTTWDKRVESQGTGAAPMMPVQLQWVGGSVNQMVAVSIISSYTTYTGTIVSQDQWPAAPTPTVPPSSGAASVSTSSVSVALATTVVMVLASRH